MDLEVFSPSSLPPSALSLDSCIMNPFINRWRLHWHEDGRWERFGHGEPANLSRMLRYLEGTRKQARNPYDLEL
jgi:hypothetical protein